VKAAQVVKNNIKEDGELPPAVFDGDVTVVVECVRADGIGLVRAVRCSGAARVRSPGKAALTQEVPECIA